MQQSSNPKELEKVRKNSWLLWLYTSEVSKTLKLDMLLHKVFVVALVIFYFTVIEKVPISERVFANDRTCIYYISLTHISSLFNRYSPKAGKTWTSDYKCLGTIVSKSLFVLWVVSVIVRHVSGYDRRLRLDTDYYLFRYVIQLLYYVLHNLPFNALDTILMLILDGTWLSRIVCTLMYNMTTWDFITFATIPLIQFANAKLFLDIVSHTKSEKRTFVNLVGPHEALFLILILTLLGSLLNLVDGFLIDYRYLLSGFLYAVYVLSMFISVSDRNMVDVSKTWFVALAVGGFALALVGHSLVVMAGHRDKVCTHEFPLYVPRKDEAEADLPVGALLAGGLDAGDEGEMEEGSSYLLVASYWVMEYLGRIFSIKGVTFTWNYVFLVWLNWLVKPIYNLTTGTLFGIVREMAAKVFYSNSDEVDDLMTWKNHTT